MMLFKPVPHREAAKFLRDKPSVSRAVFDELLPELRARAFTVTGIEAANVLQDIRDRIADLPLGGDWDKIKRDLAEKISPFLAQGDDEESKGKAEAKANRRAELLLRLHGFQAYAAAAYRVMDRQRDVFPYWMYRSMGDGKVRDSHAALNGKILPSTSPFWQHHYPPWEWSCRCQVVPLMEIDVEEIRQAEQNRPLEERRVLEGAALEAVEQRNILVSGPNRIFDLRTASQKGQRGGWEWSPGDLTLTPDQLRGRYAPEVWDKFEAWARAARVPDTQISVWQWMNGETFALNAPKAIIEAESLIINKTNEAAVAVGSDGKILLEKEGDVDRITFSVAEMQRIAGATVTHNHPSGEGFSKSDIQTAILANLAELRAVGTNSAGVGHLYSLRPATGAWRVAAWPEISAVYEALTREVEAALRAEIAGGTMTAREAGDEHSHRVLTRLAARFPKIFRYERTTI